MFGEIKRAKTKGHTPEEIALIKDHIENWNPEGRVSEYIKKGRIDKLCQAMKKEILKGSNSIEELLQKVNK